MAIIKQGILGGFQGKIGAVVGTSWKGIAVVKSKPISVANPRTAGQVEQRTKLTNIVAFAAIILSGIIKPLWDRFASKASGYNDFVSANISLFTSEMPSPAANMIISQGKMAKTSITAISASNASALVTVNWTDDSGEGFKLDSDFAYIVAVNQTKKLIALSSAETIRADGTGQVTFESACATNDSINVYLAFRRTDGTIVSNTGFLAGTASA